MRKEDISTISELLSAIAWLHGALSRNPGNFEWLLEPSKERYDAGKELLIRFNGEVEVNAD